MISITYVTCEVIDGDKHIEFELPIKVGPVRLKISKDIDFMKYNDELCSAIEKYNIHELNLSFLCTLTQEGRDKVRNAMGVADFYDSLYRTFLENITNDRIVSGFLYSRKYIKMFDLMLKELDDDIKFGKVDSVIVDRFKKVLSYSTLYCEENEAPFLPILIENVVFYDYLKELE